MPTISVAKRFALHVTLGKIIHFFPGVQEVSDEVANHWYTKLHLTKPAPSAEEGKPAEGEGDKVAAPAAPPPNRRSKR